MAEDATMEGSNPLDNFNPFQTGPGSEHPTANIPPTTQPLEGPFNIDANYMPELGENTSAPFRNKYLAWLMHNHFANLQKSIETLTHRETIRAAANTALAERVHNMSNTVANLHQEVRDLKNNNAQLQTKVDTLVRASTASNPNPIPEQKNIKEPKGKGKAGNQPASQSLKPLKFKEPASTSTTYAQVATNTNTNSGQQWTQVSKQKKPTPKKLLAPTRPEAEGKVIIGLEKTAYRLKPLDCQTITAIVNEVLADNNAPPTHRVVQTYDTSNNNLVLVCSHSCKGTDLTPYFDVIKDTLTKKSCPITIKSIQGSSKWTRFIAHGIPLTLSLTEAKASLQQSYPELELGADPRWLLPDESRTSTKADGTPRSASSIVITIKGSHTLSSLGVREIFICSKPCRLTAYLPFSSGTQCGKCYKLGHPTAMCKDPHPTCGVCAEQHGSKSHPCTIPNCRGGTQCTHRIKCATQSLGHQLPNQSRSPCCSPQKPRRPPTPWKQHDRCLNNQTPPW